MSYCLMRGPDGAVRSDCVRDDADAIVPRDDENRDWRAFLAWRAGGGVPLPPPPAPAAPLDFAAFMALFTPSEQAAIAGASDPQTRLLLLMAAGSADIELTSPALASSLDALVAAGCLPAMRKPDILARKRPN